MSAEMPAELQSFLAQLKVPQHATVMCELGFDDIDDFEKEV